MSTDAHDESLLAQALWTYAKSLAYMVASGLGVFGLFCFYVAAVDSRLSAVEISAVVGTLAVVLLVCWIGRKDTPGSGERQLKSLTLWVFYLLLCVHLIYPGFQKRTEDATNYLFLLATTLIVTLPVLCDFLLRRVVKATGNPDDRPRRTKDFWYSSTGPKDAGQEKVAGPD